MKKLVVLLVILVAALVARIELRSRSEVAPASTRDVDAIASRAESQTKERVDDAAPTPELADDRNEVPAPTIELARRPIVRLIDERTNEPVAFFALEFEQLGHARVAVETDVDGRCVLPAVLDTTLHFAENERGTDRIQTRRECASAIARSATLSASAFGDAVTDVRAPIGPTYRLRASPPPGYSLTDLSATLRSADPRQAFDSAFAQVRDATSPWVRFRATALCVAGGPPWRLELATPDGLWFGAAEVASNEGIQPGSVSIELLRRARLFGAVRDDAGQPQPGFVRIERDGASFASTENRPLFGLTNSEGGYAIRCAPAGAYTVRFHAENHRDFEARVELIEGEARELDIVVERLPQDALATLAGRVESSSGTFHDGLYAYAIPDGAGLSPRRCDIAWNEINGRTVGTFAIDVPAGGYRVRVNGGGLLDVDPIEQHWEPSVSALHFVVDDRNAAARVEFRAVEPSGRIPVTTFRVELRALGEHGSQLEVASAKDGVATFEKVPLGRACQFRALADEHQSAWGELTLTPASSRSIVVELAKGWSSEVFITDDAGAALGGVRVRFDDELAGVTDERGTLRVSLDHTPASARFERDGWKAVDSSDYSLATGRFRTWLPWLTLSMQPDK